MTLEGDYVPPHPPRPQLRRMPPLEMLRRGRRNYLELWTERNFSQEFIATGFLGRRMFLCNSPATVQEAFIERHAALQRKSPQMRHALEPLLGDGLFISDGLLWKERRRMVAPVTHASRMADLVPVMTRAVEERRAAWAARPAGQPIDMLAEMAALTAEVICRTLFGRQLGDGPALAVAAAFSRYQARVEQTAVPYLLGLPDWMARLPWPWPSREVRRIHQVVDGLVARVLAHGNPGETSLVRALAAMEDGKLRVDPVALRNEAVTLFMAGHETTANTLAWAWFLLSQAPRAAARLRAEADTVLGGRAAGWEDVPKLPFTRAVIEETLRLYPPVPVLARQAQEDTTLNGMAVPKGSLVLVVPWLLHRSPNWWEKPDHFIPERFLPGMARHPRHAFIPFSLGPRVCTGMQFGLTEAIIALATLARSFEAELAPGAVVAPVCRLTLRPGARLLMLLRPRVVAAAPLPEGVA